MFKKTYYLLKNIENQIDLFKLVDRFLSKLSEKYLPRPLETFLLLFKCAFLLTLINKGHKFNNFPLAFLSFACSLSLLYFSFLKTNKTFTSNILKHLAAINTLLFSILIWRMPDFSSEQCFLLAITFLNTTMPILKLKTSQRASLRQISFILLSSSLIPRLASIDMVSWLSSVTDLFYVIFSVIIGALLNYIITLKEKSEQRKEIENSLLRKIMKHCEVPIMVVNPKMEVLFANPILIENFSHKNTLVTLEDVIRDEEDMKKLFEIFNNLLATKDNEIANNSRLFQFEYIEDHESEVVADHTRHFELNVKLIKASKKVSNFLLIFNEHTFCEKELKGLATFKDLIQLTEEKVDHILSGLEVSKLNRTIIMDGGTPVSKSLVDLSFLKDELHIKNTITSLLVSNSWLDKTRADYQKFNPRNLLINLIEYHSYKVLTNLWDITLNFDEGFPDILIANIDFIHQLFATILENLLITLEFPKHSRLALSCSYSDNAVWKTRIEFPKLITAQGNSNLPLKCEYDAARAEHLLDSGNHDGFAYRFSKINHGVNLFELFIHKLRGKFILHPGNETSHMNRISVINVELPVLSAQSKISEKELELVSCDILSIDTPNISRCRNTISKNSTTWRLKPRIPGISLSRRTNSVLSTEMSMSSTRTSYHRDRLRDLTSNSTSSGRNLSICTPPTPKSGHQKNTSSMHTTRVEKQFTFTDLLEENQKKLSFFISEDKCTPFSHENENSTPSCSSSDKIFMKINSSQRIPSSNEQEKQETGPIFFKNVDKTSLPKISSLSLIEDERRESLDEITGLIENKRKRMFSNHSFGLQRIDSRIIDENKWEEEEKSDLLKVTEKLKKQKELREIIRKDILKESLELVKPKLESVICSYIHQLLLKGTMDRSDVPLEGIQNINIDYLPGQKQASNSQNPRKRSIRLGTHESDDSQHSLLVERTPLITPRSRILMSPGLFWQQQKSKENSITIESSKDKKNSEEEKIKKHNEMIKLKIAALKNLINPFGCDENQLPEGIRIRGETAHRAWNLMTANNNKRQSYFIVYGDMIQDMILVKEVLDTTKCRCELSIKEHEALEKFEILANTNKTSHIVFFYLNFKDEDLLWRLNEGIKRQLTTHNHSSIYSLVGFYGPDEKNDESVKKLILEKKHPSLNVFMAKKPITKSKLEELLFNLGKIKI